MHTNVTIEANLSAGANQNNPTAVDLVFVNDKALLKEIVKLPAKDWFDKREEIQRDHPNEIGLNSWEWVPNQSVAPFQVQVGAAAKGALLFINMMSQGPNRAPVDPLGAAWRINVGPKDFKVLRIDKVKPEKNRDLKPPKIPEKPKL